ncbi:hypothetical protein [Arenibaculum pallidiluteum]|uniref:hypothetical protein n=1 Tax=Arenibaculum pallidiluteum TaxID=2812559 RepID=UPI001A95DBAA|nr:hypothetical protein [Arenibaculum pallidiluteum]
MLAFTMKLVLTAGVVVAVTWLVERLGPRAGGIAVGLPIVLGPGYLFIALEKPPAYVADASLASLAGLAGVLAFLITHVRIAPASGPVLTLAASILAWGAMGLVMATAQPELPVTAAILAAGFLLARATRGRHDFAARPAAARATPTMMLGRAVPAGLLVAAVAGSSAALGETAAGVLITFPVGLTAVGWIVHRRLGGRLAAATMAAAQTGILGLLGFLLTVHLTAGRIAPMAGITLALLVSLLPGAVTALQARLAAPAREQAQ